MAHKLTQVLGPFETLERSWTNYPSGPRRGQPRELMVCVGPHCISLWPKGTRQKVTITHGLAYQRALEIESSRGVNAPATRRNVRRSAIGKF